MKKQFSSKSTIHFDLRMKCFLFLFIIIGISSCGDETKTPETPIKSGATTDTVKAPEENNKPTAVAPAQSRQALPNSHQCILAGTVLEDNSYWIKTAQTLVGISADSTTKDMDFGDSHRIFTALNTADCSILFKETLPINRSPDFPWYLNTNTYESVNQVLCMQGISFIYCYDVSSKKMLPQMKPEFYKKRVALDAQSGTPAGLAIWEQYLIGYSLDLGGSVFDLGNKTAPKAILPSAEFYSENDESYHSLFLLANKDGKYQAVMPTLNEDQDGMIANPLFKKVQALNPTINKSVKDNRFIILNSSDGKSKTAIDMEKMSTIEVPTEVLNKNVSVILEWLKKSQK